jgi:hypothetical protein
MLSKCQFANAGRQAAGYGDLPEFELCDRTCSDPAGVPPRSGESSMALWGAVCELGASRSGGQRGGGLTADDRRRLVNELVIL